MISKAKLAVIGILTAAVIGLVAITPDTDGSDVEESTGQVTVGSAPVGASDGGTGGGPMPSESSKSVEGFVDLEDAAAGIQKAAAAFLEAYTTNPGADSWADALGPVATPEMVASITTSDPAIAEGLASAQVGEPSDMSVPVAVDGQITAHLTLVQIPSAPEEEITADTPWMVRAIDFSAVTDRALPLSTNSPQEIATAIKPSVGALVVQPAGLTDEARREQIAASFAAPDAALEVPRLGSEAERIEMGNIHDVQLAASADGDLVATVVVPWLPSDGESPAQWASYSIRLGRTGDGSWTAVDVFEQPPAA